MAGTQTGYAATITMDSGFFAKIRDIRLTGFGSREAIDTSHAGLTEFGTSDRAFMTYIPSDLIDPGTMEADIEWNADTAPPMENDAETVTITWPTETGETTPSSVAASGFVTNIDIASNGHGSDVWTGTITVKFSGNITYTAST